MNKKLEVVLTMWDFDSENSDSWNDFLDQLGIPQENRLLKDTVTLTISDFKIE